VGAAMAREAATSAAENMQARRDMERPSGEHPPQEKAGAPRTAKSQEFAVVALCRGGEDWRNSA
jgi:hypothetical protein